MLLEYFDDESPHPVLLLHGSDAEETLRLRAAVKALGDGRETAFRVEDLPGFDGVAGCSLVAQVGEANLGVERVQDADRAFRCVRDPEGWRHIWWLLEPFVDPESGGDPNRFQYLDESGAIEWIISGSRGW